MRGRQESKCPPFKIRAGITDLHTWCGKMRRNYCRWRQPCSSQRSVLSELWDAVVERSEKGGGTEADGRKSITYCSHCYGRRTVHQSRSLRWRKCWERVRAKMKEMCIFRVSWRTLSPGTPLRRGVAKVRIANDGMSPNYGRKVVTDRIQFEPVKRSRPVNQKASGCTQTNEIQTGVWSFICLKRRLHSLRDQEALPWLVRHSSLGNRYSSCKFRTAIESRTQEVLCQP